MVEMADVEQIIHISSSVSSNCSVCGQIFPGMDPDFAEMVNHYIGHGLTLLHIGQETTRDDQGAPWHSTVALLGS
jgi:hypothetical protein